MTLDEYLDPQRFPLTTRTHYTPKDQLFMDAFNYDGGKEYLEDGNEFTDEEDKQRWAELCEKMKHMGRLTGELADAEIAAAKKAKGD